MTSLTRRIILRGAAVLPTAAVVNTPLSTIGATSAISPELAALMDEHARLKAAYSESVRRFCDLETAAHEYVGDRPTLPELPDHPPAFDAVQQLIRLSISRDPLDRTKALEIINRFVNVHEELRTYWAKNDAICTERDLLAKDYDFALKRAKAQFGVDKLDDAVTEILDQIPELETDIACYASAGPVDLLAKHRFFQERSIFEEGEWAPEVDERNKAMVEDACRILGGA